VLSVAPDIIHGDIKPQNVLLMDFDGSIVPQVTDFGYSTAYTSSDSPIIHSRTVPWNAPEVGTDSKAYTPTDAIRTDTFSFGMFCLWVLFREQVADHFGLTQDFVDQCKPSESNISSSFRVMTNLKNQDQLRPFCQILVRSLQLEPSQRESLEQLFEATLSPQPSERADSFKLLCKCLDSSLTNKASNKAIPAVDLVGHKNGRGASGQHFDFEVIASLADYWFVSDDY
jgi:serine/threonine protein kinase